MGFPVVRMTIINVRRHARAATASNSGTRRGNFSRHDSLLDSPAGRVGSVRWARLDCENGARSVEQDSLGIRPQDQLANRSAATKADHDEVCFDFLGHLDQVLSGFVATDELADLVLDTDLVEMGLDGRQLS